MQRATDAKKDATVARNYVYRLQASPRQVRTQIAKISYVSPRSQSTAKSSVRVSSASSRRSVVMVTTDSARSPVRNLAINNTQQQRMPSPRPVSRVDVHTPRKDGAVTEKSPHSPRPVSQVHTHTPRKNEIVKEKSPQPELERVQSLNTIPVLTRSKTETAIEQRPKAATTRRGQTRSTAPTQRSRSSQPTGTVARSNDMEKDGAQAQKRRTHDREVTRRFMEEQKRKRRALQSTLPPIASAEKSAFEKEQIKKRLEKLSKYSRDVVNKNLMKKRTDQLATNLSKTIATAAITFKKSTAKRKAANVEAPAETTKQETSEQIVKPPQHAPATEKPKDDMTPAVYLPKPLISKELLENHKRIGLLRKEETKDHSFSAIKEFSFSKDNVALKMLTPSVNMTSQPSHQQESTTTKPVENEEFSFNKENIASDKQSKHAVNDMKLQTPAMTLESTENRQFLRERSVQGQATSALFSELTESNNDKPTDLPYWLKPSAVQIYPYNFIMAVRRKLDALVQPQEQQTNVAQATSSNGDLHWQKIPAEAPVTSASKEHVAEAQPNAKRRIELQTNDSVAQSDSFHTRTRSPSKAQHGVAHSSKYASKESIYKSQTLSELCSNFSSISIAMPTASNTVSEVSSLRSESVRVPSKTKETRKSKEDDYTTVSSSVFNSPEKKLLKEQKQHIKSDDLASVMPKPVSPLSLERVDKLKIASRAQQPQAINSRHITMQRGDSDQRTNDAANVSVDFEQLLNDFNESLSQVIQVNAQLKSTLDQSFHICNDQQGSAGSVQTTPDDDHYTADFEEFTSTHRDGVVDAAALGDGGDIALEKQRTERINKNLQQQQQKSDNGIDVLKQRTERVNENLQKQQRTLFKLTNDVKPLLTSPRTESSERCLDSSKLLTNEEKQQLDLNLESLSNSSSGQFTTETPSKTDSNIALSAELFEQRLKDIEMLKADLKQAISNAKADRAYDDEASPNGSATKLNSRRFELRHKPASMDLKSALERERKLTSSPPTHQQSIILPPTAATASTAIAAADSTQSPSESLHSNASSSPKGKTFVINTTDNSSIEEQLVITSNGTSSKNDDKANVTRDVSEELMRSHITTERGDFLLNLTEGIKAEQTSLLEAGDAAVSARHSHGMKSSVSDASIASVPPPSYTTVDVAPHSTSPPPPPVVTDRSAPALSTSRDDKHHHASNAVTTAAIFSQSDYELSIVSSRNGSISETSLNYSTVGVFEQLIQKETTKSERLTALLRIREKALLDRTKGQIALLEVQKERYKAKGLMPQIATIKKKQRAILLKMAKEREEIKRLLQSATASSTTTTAHTTARPPTPPTPPPAAAADAVVIAKTETTATPIKRLSSSTVIAASPRSSALPHSGKDLDKGAARTHASEQETKFSISINSNHSQSGKRYHIARTKTTTRSQPTVLQPSEQQQQQQRQLQRTTAIVRANYELESSRSLEELLRQRETDLRRRRDHVEHLMQWHRRLDQEEAEVLQLEHQLYHFHNNANAQQLNNNNNNNNNKTAITATTTTGRPSSPASKENHHQRPSTHSTHRMERRLREIDRSLRELSSISTTSTATTTTTAGDESGMDGPANAVDYVRTTGSKLNKLWRRLTSQQVEKFEPNQRFKLCKSDLAAIYEEAKLAVLRDFAQDDERLVVELLEQTSHQTLTPTRSSGYSPLLNGHRHHQHHHQHRHIRDDDGDDDDDDDDGVDGGDGGSSDIADADGDGDEHGMSVPHLELNSSSAPSEECIGAVELSHSTSLSHCNYSPSAAEEYFHGPQIPGSPASQRDSSPTPTIAINLSASSRTSVPAVAQQTDSNVRRFLTQQCQHQRRVVSGGSVQRSLSDTEISERLSERSTVISECNFTRSGTAVSPKRQSLILSVAERTTHSSGSIHEDDNNNNGDSGGSDSVHTLYSVRSLQVSGTNSLTESDHIDEALATRHSSVICSLGNAGPLSDGTSPAATSSVIVSTANDTETQAREISAKLEEISAAVLKLSQSNATLPPQYQFSTNGSSSSAAKAPPTPAPATISPPATASASLTSDSNTIATHNSSSSDANASELLTPTPQCAQPPTTTTTTTPSATPTPTNSAPLPTSSDIAEEALHGSTNASSAQYSSEFEEQQQSEAIQSQPSIANTQTHSMAGRVDDDGEATITAASDTVERDDIDIGGVGDVGDSDRIGDASKSPHYQTNAEEQAVLDATSYEADFESTSELTYIGDMSLPQFETTLDTTLDFDQQPEQQQQQQQQQLESNVNATTAAEPQSVIVVSEQQQHELLSPSIPSPAHQHPPPPPPIPPAASTSSMSKTQPQAGTSSSASTQLMPPDIISELEIRRCQQILVENEHLKQYEQVTAVPYYMREIPNKPPPPYVPPAHGSPMTTIFPSVERIRDLTYRRAHELYCKMLKTDYTNDKGELLPSVLEEKITNIYERIILDICREYLEEHQEVLSQGDPTNFHSQLAFFNPPDRLRCIQESIYKEVRRSLAMDKQPPKRSQVYSVYGQRARRDHIGKIIIQEMYDEDDQWCNFHREENEVLQLILDDMIASHVQQLSKEVLLAEGGIVEEESNADEDDERSIHNISVVAADHAVLNNNEQTTSADSECAPPPAVMSSATVEQSDDRGHHEEFSLCEN